MTLVFNQQVEIFDDEDGGSIKVEPWNEGEPNIRIAKVDQMGTILSAVVITQDEAAMLVRALRVTLKAANHNPKTEK